MKNFNMLIDRIESQTLSYEMLSDLANLAKFLLVYDKKIDNSYKNLALDVILTFLDMTKPIKSLVYSKVYYYENFIYLYLFLEKYESHRKEVAELNKYLTRLSESQIIMGSEKGINQEVSLSILKKQDLKKYKNYYEKRISNFLENPFECRLLSYDDMILCLYLKVENISKYMKKVLTTYYYFKSCLEFLLCKAEIRTVDKAYDIDSFTSLFIKIIIEEEEDGV